MTTQTTEPLPSVHAIDTLTLEWAAREDSLRKAADETQKPDSLAQAAPGAEGEEAPSPPLSGTNQGNGSLSGRVVSEMSGTVIAKARVILAGREKSVETDADGHFGFADLPPGAYSLLITHSDFAPLLAESLSVVSDKGSVHRLRMPDKALQGEQVRITGKAGKASDAGLLFAQKNAPGVSDGISSEQVSKSPDGDAAAAIKRVTGISIGGDGMVYVRGLGERYVNVQLNGLTLSSPNSEKRVIPLDIFPTRLLENMIVSKTFTAEQPGEFAGGSIQLRTKDYPDKPLLEFSASGGYEQGATFGDMYTYQGGKLDWLGFEDGTRELPALIPEETFDHRTENLGSTPAERQAKQREMLAALPNTWSPTKTSVPLNQSYGLSMGNRIPLGDDRIFGWLMGLSYAGKWGVDKEDIGRIKQDGIGKYSYIDRFSNDISKQSVLWGGLGTGTLVLSEMQKYRLNILANRDWEDKVTRVEGTRESDGPGNASLTNLLTNANQTLLNLQVEGEHGFGEEGAFKLNWTGSGTSASRVEPDRRLSKYFLAKPDHPFYDSAFPYNADITLGLQDRYWFDLQEKGGGGKIDVEMPFPWLGEEGSHIKAGVFAFQKTRTYDIRQLTYKAGNRVLGTAATYAPYEEVFELFNGLADSGYINNRSQNPKNNYEVDDFQWAVHAQSDFVWHPSFRTITGLRLVRNQAKGQSKSAEGQLTSVEKEYAECGEDQECILPFGYEGFEYLPSISAIVGVTESQNLRASWTRTLAYPEYREMAPMLFFSYQEALEIVGNPKLKTTSIDNYDLRWEFFPSPGDLLALSGFYKHFENPVETRIQRGGSNNRATFANAPSAVLYGIEAELRTGLSRIHSLLRHVEIITNYTYIYSEVEGITKRPMQGQSPYLINAILMFEPFDGALQMSLLYNYMARRIAKVGVGTTAEAFPDVYDEAKQSLEFSWTQRLTRAAKAKFTAKNITNAITEETQGGLSTRRIEPGRSFSLGVSYAF